MARVKLEDLPAELCAAIGAFTGPIFQDPHLSWKASMARSAHLWTTHRTR